MLYHLGCHPLLQTVIYPSGTAGPWSTQVISALAAGLWADKLAGLSCKWHSLKGTLRAHWALSLQGTFKGDSVPCDQVPHDKVPCYKVLGDRGAMTSCPVTVCPVTKCSVTKGPMTRCPVTVCPATNCPMTRCPVTGDGQQGHSYWGEPQ